MGIVACGNWALTGSCAAGSRFRSDLSEYDGASRAAQRASWPLRESPVFRVLRWDPFDGSSAPATHILSNDTDEKSKEGIIHLHPQESNHLHPQTLQTNQENSRSCFVARERIYAWGTRTPPRSTEPGPKLHEDRSSFM
ncbi:uncharacterized protein LOC130684966 isoform X4 [Manis pentadactyla]|uniref:uncharacterized protein LOC130684966 isoform X4 n=1 Tax=Manis pentadactyla TaxID=143292 RepID=UPI00255C4FC6|nr:uncharacterized protein LOC130684966 isoform X4 [Manis pentadactyla]